MLITLSMNKNQLVNLEGLENLTALESLSVAENQLTSITGIINCPKLKKLNLQGNKIETFDTVPDLPGLQEINMTGCPIAKIEEIGKLITLRNLNSLNLTETPLAEEKGDELKKEVLILLDGLNFKSFNGEEVTPEDIAEAKETKAERIKLDEEAVK
jgi:Leucine-rich repeat (LRR) protein